MTVFVKIPQPPSAEADRNQGYFISNVDMFDHSLLKFVLKTYFFSYPSSLVEVVSVMVAAGL